MANVKTISFGAGNGDLEVRQADLQRRQKMIELLRQNASTPQDTQVVSGRAVSNKWQGLAQLAQTAASVYAQKNVDSEQAVVNTEKSKRQAEALRSMAPAGVFEDPQPQQRPAAPPIELTSQPQSSAPGDAPVMQQQQQQGMAPELKERWLRALKTYEQNPEIGGKLIADLNKEAEYSTTPQYDQGGRAFVLNNQGGQKYLDGVSARDKMENVNGVWQNPYAQGSGTIAPQDPNQPFMQGANGPVANQPYQDYAMSKAKAGATNVSNKTEVAMGKSIAGEIGPILKDSKIAAEGASAQIDSGNRILSALDSNKVFSGPLASKRMSLAQVGQTIGVGGKDDAEKIANTRQVIRGFAELTLQGRKSMRGEGAITESEGKLAERAMSGDIDSMTPAEMKIVVQASQRAARHNMTEHERRVGLARANPDTAGMADYFKVSPMEASPQPAPSRAPSTTGFKVIR